MNFLEAMKALTEGKKIRMKTWVKGYFIVLDSSKAIVGCLGGFAFIESYSVKEEWEIYEEPKTLKQEYEELYNRIGEPGYICNCKTGKSLVVILKALIEKEIARQEATK